MLSARTSLLLVDLLVLVCSALAYVDGCKSEQVECDRDAADTDASATRG